MKAVQVVRFGDPSVLEVANLPDPEPGAGEISIDVTHAAVGLVDVFFRQGHFKDVPGMAQPPFVPGLEVAGTVRALGPGVAGFAIGDRVVAMSDGSGTGGYASIFIAQAARCIVLRGNSVSSRLAVSMIPNAAMAHVALTRVARLAAGESVLIHGAMGGLAAGFAAMAKQLGASRIVGTVRQSRLDAAKATGLPYDDIVDSAQLPGVLADEKFDVVIDPVGGSARSSSLELMRLGGRLIVAGNASGDWAHEVKTNDLWLQNKSVIGFNAGAYLQAFPELVQPALAAALQAVIAGFGDINVEELPFEEAAMAHTRMEGKTIEGRIVLVP
jgi:NADPH2:quinone reductase